jgi:hypothetical protein
MSFGRFYVSPDHTAGHNCYQVIDSRVGNTDFGVARGLSLFHAVEAQHMFEATYSQDLEPGQKNWRGERSARWPLELGKT